MTVKSREVVEGIQIQGVDEQIAYKIITTSWASNPVVTGIVAYDITDGDRNDVSTLVIPGVASTTGDIITLPLLKSLIAEHQYRVEVKFTSSGNTYECYFVVHAEN